MWYLVWGGSTYVYTNQEDAKLDAAMLGVVAMPCIVQLKDGSYWCDAHNCSAYECDCAWNENDICDHCICPSPTGDSSCTRKQDTGLFCLTCEARAEQAAGCC